MGMSPRDVDAMELCQFYFAVDGWNRSQNPDEAPPPPSADRYRQILEEQE